MSFLTSRRGTAVLAAAAIATATALAGCSAPADNGGGSEGADGTVIGIANAFLGNSFNQAAVALLTQYSEEAGFAPLEPTNADGDSSQQISDVQSLVSRGAKAILLTPNDSDALAGVVGSTVSQGIPVVTPNIGVNSDQVFVNVRPSGIEMGTLQCEALEGNIPDDAQIFYVAGFLSDSTGRERWESFDACVQENYPGVTVTMKEAKWDPVESTTIIETAFGSGQQYDALVLASDSVYGPGAISTLKKLNLLFPVGDEGHIYLSGIDGSPEGLQAIRDGFMDNLVAQPLVQQCEEAVKYLKLALEGGTVEAGPTEHGSEIIEENGVLTDFIPALFVTIDNVDDKAIWGNTVS
jgi:ribose transport system substrate-binding protein